MPYLRVAKTPLVRRTPLGTYLCVPYGFMLESFSPIMKINESTEELLRLCDGTRTREDILKHLSKESGEPIEEFADDFDKFIDYLVGEGILEWREELSVIEPIYKRDRPLSITMDITSACNLNCPFCSANAGTPKTNELTMDDIVPYVEQLKELKPTPLALSGGEPLLKKEIVLYMLEELSSVDGITMTVFTNGTLVDKDYAQQLYDAGLKIARVSIDGHTEQLHDAVRGKGNFKKTMQGIKYLKELGIHIDTVSVISKINYLYMKEIKEFVSQIADTSNLAPVVPYGRGTNSALLLSPEETFNVKIANMKSEKIQTNISPRNRCNIGETIYVAANGDIFPCFYMQAPELKVGNIRENSLTGIYENGLMQDYLDLTVDSIEGCSNCEIRYQCGGGCRGFAYSDSNSAYVPDPYDCGPNKIMTRKILDEGEENTKRLLQELLESTRALG